MTSPRVLIIIVIHNAVPYLEPCLTSLAAAIYPAGFEILIIDNASTDGGVDYLRQHWSELTLITNQHNLGFAAANNLGFSYGIDHNFDYVFLLNQDTVVDQNFLAQAVIVAEQDQSIAAVQSKLLLFHDSGKINSIGNEIHYLGFAFAGGYQQADQSLESKNITYASGASVLIRTAAIKKTGMFNPDFFMYHEDTDLGWRFWLDGFRVVLAPQSVVYHKYEFSRSIAKYYYMERNRYLVILQNYHWATIILVLPALLLMELGLFAYSLVSGWWREKIKVYGYFFKLSSWRKIIDSRHQVQKKRKITDRQMLKHFTDTIEFQEVANPLLQYVLNPCFRVYGVLLRWLVWW